VSRPVYGMTIRRYADGRTEVTDAVIADANLGGTFRMPEFHEHRHAMLVDALVEVNKERARAESNPG
jgi:hypothetical protein